MFPHPTASTYTSGNYHFVSPKRLMCLIPFPLESCLPQASIVNWPFYPATIRLFIMCTYGKTHAEHVNCTRAQHHKIETRLRKRCIASPKPGPACSNPTHDSTMDRLPSTKGGPCPGCRDSAATAVIYKTTWVSRACSYPCLYVLNIDGWKVDLY